MIGQLKFFRVSRQRKMVDSVDDFYKWICGNKNLKTVTTPVDDFELVDIGMKCYGGDTAVYLKNHDLQVRMRRGLTFVRKAKEFQIARQGLPKFFDLDIPAIERPESSLVPESSFPITIYNLEKLNGENAQISWSALLQRWIICSKNVAIAVHDLDHAREEFGSNQRFAYALHIARHWFEKTVPGIKEMEKLKDLLSHHTLVGEVVDLSNAQHIVDNPVKHGLIFFAIVPKKPSGDNTPLCVLPNEAIPVFSRHGLQHVEVGESCTLDSRSDIGKLKTFVDQITIDKCDHPYVCLSEGSVVYATENGTGRVLFLAKVKTTKYRVLRRLRELMKRAASSDCLPGTKEESNMRNGYKQDVRKWGLDETVYLRLFDVANRTRVEGKWTESRIGNWYIEFLRECTSRCDTAAAIPAPSIPVEMFQHESELESSASEDDNFAKQKTHGRRRNRNKKRN